MSMNLLAMVHRLPAQQAPVPLEKAPTASTPRRTATMSRKPAKQHEDEWSAAYRRPEWQKKRLDVMDAAGFKCEACGAADRELNIHHRRYVKGRMPWEYGGRELVCLCDKCHELWHYLQGQIMLSVSLADLQSMFQLTDITGFTGRKLTRVALAANISPSGLAVACTAIIKTAESAEDNALDGVSIRMHSLASENAEYAELRRRSKVIEDAAWGDILTGEAK
jgi:hypothetical protein